MRRQAVADSTTQLVLWAQLRAQPLSQAKVQEFLEKQGIPMVVQSSPSKTGKLRSGELVIVDKNENTNDMNVDECELWHDKAGRVQALTDSGVTVQFDSGELVHFDGQSTGKSTGLYRHTPRGSGVEDKNVLIEIVYERNPKGVTRPTRMENIDEYLAKGEDRGEDRSRNYYSGNVAKMGISKEGNLFFLMYPAQRAGKPTAISPAKGSVLYIGRPQARPGGWRKELESFFGQE